MMHANKTLEQTLGASLVGAAQRPFRYTDKRLA